MYHQLIVAPVSPRVRGQEKKKKGGGLNRGRESWCYLVILRPA